VLSTVAKVVEIYTTYYPERKIYFSGYSPQLTKIYQRAIVNDYHLISELYNVYGDTDNRIDSYKFEPFATTNNYYGFMIERK
jgi:hypothetical protein